MKRFRFVLFVVLSFNLVAQQDTFPKSWEGNWKGNLKIFSASQPNLEATQEIPMSLTIQPIDENRWSWIISYEAQGQEPRNYELQKDSLNNWKIDEKNGIVLQQAFVANRMVSSFSVMGSLLICYYWLEGETMHVEIHMIGSEGVSETGLNTTGAPTVSEHRFGVLQKAVLNKVE